MWRRWQFRGVLDGAYQDHEERATNCATGEITDPTFNGRSRDGSDQLTNDAAANRACDGVAQRPE